MNQILLPVGVSAQVTELEIARLKSFGAAMELCATAAGIDLDKDAQLALGVDKGQFSRWKNGGEGIKEDRLYQLMDYCNNDIPLFYLNYRRGYDIANLRKRESELEKQLRLEREENEKLREKLSHFEEFAKIVRAP